MIWIDEAGNITPEQVEKFMADKRRCIAHGKQVLLDGHHIADAISEAAAAVIADCVEYIGHPNFEYEYPDAAQRVESYLA